MRAAGKPPRGSPGPTGRAAAAGRQGGAMHVRALVLMALLGLAAGADLARAAASVTITPLARSGMAAPDGNGTFGNYTHYREPVLNDAGEAAFTGRFLSTLGGGADDDYLVRASRSGVRVVL